MLTITATELVRNLRAVLDRVRESSEGCIGDFADAHGLGLVDVGHGGSGR